jgi:putative endonuclease
MKPHRGAEAEALAAAFLERKGLRVIERNFRCRLGEIDLVARDGDTTVFIEVRHRASSTAYGGARASITSAKRAKLLRTARFYLSRQRTMPACRFDALLIEGDPPRIDWIRDAFGA